ncbi:MAG: peptidoglycan-binding protein, partial [Patescibacteria group bacterium]
VSTTDAAMTWSRSLKQGSRGADVKDLQVFLNMCADTKVSNSGAGSPGMETSYFGPATKAAVIKFQAARGVSPQSGLFGPLSRAKAADLQASSNVCGGGVVVNPPQSGPVSAMLAANNPATGTLVAGQATADLAHFTFSGMGTVTAVTLQRLGVSADTTPSNVYLFDGAVRLTDAASVSNNGSVTFSMPSGIFSVNGLKTISVKSDIATGTSGQTVGFMLATFTTSSGVMTVNLSGNIHNIASATLATVSAGTVTPSGATLNPGANVTLWQSTLTVSNRDVWMKRISLRNIGSAPASAFANFKLYVNGVMVGTATGLDANGYVTFDMNAAPVLVVSGSRVVRIDADIISGASRTVHLSLRNAADVDFVDSSFGVNITASSTPWAASSANTISGSSGGSLTIEKDVSSSSGNVSEGTNDKVIGVFKATAFGEPMKIETLRATFTGSDADVDSLRNGRIMIGGVQYGSTATLLEDTTGIFYTAYTLNYTVYPGTPVLIEIRADIYDNDGTDNLSNGDTIIGTIAAGSSNVQKVDSLGTISAPSVAVAGNTLTVADASATLTKNGTYANQTVVLPTTGFKVGSWNLAGSSTEDILLTTLSFDVDEVDTTGGVFNEADMTNLYAVVKSGATTVASTSPVATVSATDNNFSINYTLVKNTNVSIELFANLADAGTAAVAPNSVKSDLTVTGTAMVSGAGVTATSADTDGQTIIVGSASITATQDASTPAASIVYDNQTATAAAFKFAAVTAAYNITDLTFTLADATVASSVDLYDGATLVASRPGAATVTFSGLAWNVPANQNKVLTAKLVLGSVGVGAGSTGASQLLTLTAFTAINQSTGVSALGTESDPAGNAMYAYAAVPSIQQLALPNLTMTAGTNTIAKFSVTSNGGSIAWKEVLLDINKSAAPTLSSVTLWDVTSGASQVTAVAAFQNGTAGVATTCVADNTFCELMVTVGTKADDNVEQQVSGTKTYEVRATIGGTLAADVYVSSTLTSNLGFVASNVFTTADNSGAANNATFVWSDISAQSHDTGTADWSNEYKVVGIPTASSWTLTY